MSCYIFPHQSLLGNFRGISHHSVPPPGLVTLWTPGAYSFVPYPQMQPLPIRAHFLSMPIPQATMALGIYCLRITDTWREKGGHLRMEDFYFCLSFFARALAKGAAPSQSELTPLVYLDWDLERELGGLFPGLF